MSDRTRKAGAKHERAAAPHIVSKTSFRAVFEASAVAMAIGDAQGGIVEANPTFCELFGYSQDELRAKTLVELAHPDDADPMSQLIDLLVRGARRHGRLETRQLRKDGGLIWGDVCVSAIREENGDFRHAVVVLEDITQRKQAEEALRQSETRFKAVIENMPVMMDALDVQGTIVMWNRECEQVTGYRAAEIVGNPEALSLLYPDTPEMKREFVTWAKEGSDFRGSEWNITCKDGSTRTIAWSNISQTVPVPGWAIWGIGVDITERKQAEEKLRRKQSELAHVGRLSTMGEMAAGLAHELNQPLAAIASYAFSCQQVLADGEAPAAVRAIELLERLGEQTQRAGGIVRGLRDFVRKSAPHRSTNNLNELIREMIPLVEPEARLAGVDFEMDLDRSTLHVVVDRIQIRQVLINLIRNAIDAMVDTEKGGKRIVLATRSAERGQSEVSVRVFWKRDSSDRSSPPLRYVFHDQDRRNGNGAGDQPLDHRGARGTAVG